MLFEETDQEMTNGTSEPEVVGGSFVFGGINPRMEPRRAATSQVLS